VRVPMWHVLWRLLVHENSRVPCRPSASPR
jgi:hypothetical protein